MPPLHINCRCAVAPAGITVMPPHAHIGKGEGEGEGEPDVAFLLIRTRNDEGKRRYLLQKRGDGSPHAGDWGLPGGKGHSGENAWETAIREAREEMGGLPELNAVCVMERIDGDGERKCSTFVCDVDAEFVPNTGAGLTPEESAGWGWFSRGEIEDLPLHPGFAETWAGYLEQVLGKSVRRRGPKRVLVSGQEIYPDDDETGSDDLNPPSGGGGEYPHPHNIDPVMQASGGRSGDEGPHWDGGEAEPYVATMNGPGGGTSIREGRVPKSPGKPKGSGTGGEDGGEQKPKAIPLDGNVPDDEDDAAQPFERGRPPNGVGKSAAEYSDPNPVEAEHILSVMRENFPEKALGWVKRARWIGPVQVPWERVNTANIDSWAASHQLDGVRRFAREIQAGTGHLHPSILIQREDDDKCDIVDGHHRALARRALGKPVLAYIGFVRGKDVEAALETHSSQIHSGTDPKNI